MYSKYKYVMTAAQLNNLFVENSSVLLVWVQAVHCIGVTYKLVQTRLQTCQKQLSQLLLHPDAM